MGQHKTNPTAIAAKAGQLPPRPQKRSKRDTERLLYKTISEVTGAAAISRTLHGPYGGYVR